MVHLHHTLLSHLPPSKLVPTPGWACSSPPFPSAGQWRLLSAHSLRLGIFPTPSPSPSPGHTGLHGGVPPTASLPATTSCRPLSASIGTPAASQPPDLASTLLVFLLQNSCSREDLRLQIWWCQFAGEPQVPLHLASGSGPSSFTRSYLQAPKHILFPFLLQHSTSPCLGCL